MVLYNLILHKKYAKVGMKTSKGEQKMRKGVKVTALLLGAVLLLGLAACGKKMCRIRRQQRQAVKIQRKPQQF